MGRIRRLHGAFIVTFVGQRESALYWRCERNVMTNSRDRFLPLAFFDEALLAETRANGTDVNKYRRALFRSGVYSPLPFVARTPAAAFHSRTWDFEPLKDFLYWSSVNEPPIRWYQEENLFKPSAITLLPGLLFPHLQARHLRSSVRINSA